MRNSLVAASLFGAISIAISGCTLAEIQSLNWPRADEAIAAPEQVEIERLLRKLGYFNGKVDGAITSRTRTAIVAYQGSIGAPENGYVSQILLENLRRTAGVAAAPVTAPSTPKPATGKSNQSDSGWGGGSDNSGGGDSGGGGGGGGGSSWG